MQVLLQYASYKHPSSLVIHKTVKFLQSNHSRLLWRNSKLFSEPANKLVCHFSSILPTTLKSLLLVQTLLECIELC